MRPVPLALAPIVLTACSANAMQQSSDLPAAWSVSP
jgi:hypothetical protein